MIISKITSGLGNQLFQYAIAKSLAAKNKTSLYLDLRYYQHQYDTDTSRSYKLNNFNIDAQLFNESKIWVLLSKSTKLFPGRTCIPFFKLVNETYHHFNPQVLYSKALFVYLKGYWQSAKYFDQFSTAIRKDLTFKENKKPDFLQYKAKILNASNPISIHIRRGDYVHHPEFSKTFGFIGLEYYLKAVKLMKSKFTDQQFFIFSDDQDWVQKNFQLTAADTFVKTSGEDTDLDDLQLMSLCKHHIIANSSFSWWGAWLNPNPNKQVIAPANWYKNQPEWNIKDLIPDNWIKL